MIEEIISQEPVQQPPYKKKVFDILSSNFDDFKLGEQDFYKKIAADKTYAGKVHDVLIQNFSDFKKPRNEFIDSLTFQEPLKKKDQEVSQYVSSPIQSQSISPDLEKGRAFAEKGFLMKGEGNKEQKRISYEPSLFGGVPNIKVLEEGEEPSALADISGAVAKGVLQGKVANILSAGKRPTVDELGEIAQLQSDAQLFPQSKSEKVYQEKGLKGLFKDNPLLGVQFVAETMASSLSALVQASTKTVPAAVAMGAAAGAPTGVGAMVGAGYGLLAGQSAAGYNLSTSQDILNSLSENGVDVSDKASLIKAFSDENKMAKIRNTAAKYGVPILIFDAATAGLAGKLGAGAVGKSLSKKLLAGLGETGIQIAGGMGGELSGQLASGKKVNWDDIVMEGLAEVPGGAVEVATGVAIERSKSSSNNKTLATQIATQGVQNGTEDAIVNLNRDLFNNVITPEQHQEGINFVEKASQVAEKVPENVTGENRAKSIELLVERDNVKEANQNLIQQKQASDEAYHAGIDEEIKANEERIKKIDSEVYDITKKPEKGTKKYTVDGKEVTQEEFDALQNKPIGTKEIIKEEVKPTEVKDIEKRRQEELFTPSSLQKPTTDKDILNNREFGKKVVESAVKAGQESKIMDVINLASKGRSAETIAKQTGFSEEAVRSIRDYLGIETPGGFSMGGGAATENEEADLKRFNTWKQGINEINAKYDAELSALEAKPTEVKEEIKIEEPISTQKVKIPGTKQSKPIPLSDFTLEKEGERSFTKRIKKDDGGVSGVEPLNQFKLNQGWDANGNPYPRVHVILDNADAEKYQATLSLKAGGRKIAKYPEFRDEINRIAKANRSKDDEVVLDFRKSEIDLLSKKPEEVKSATIKAEVEPSIETDIKTQIEDFGVPKEDVEPVNTMLSNIHESLKKSGLTSTNTLSEWVGIGKGTKEKGALFQPTIYGKSGIIKRPSFDKASADKAIKSGRVKVISPKKSLEDLTFAITHWDDLFVGDIFHNDKKIGSFDGGVFYPLNGGEKGKMGASVNPQSAGAFATQSNRSLFKNNGIKLPESFDEGTFVIEKGSNKNEWVLTNKSGEKVTVTLPDNPKPGVVVIGKGDNLKHKSSLSAKVGFVNTLLSYAKGKEGYDGLINAIKSVYSIGNTRNADSVIDLFNNYLKSGRMADGQTMSEAKTSYENFRAALIKDANPIITNMMRDMGYTDAEYFDGTQLKKGIYKATGKGIDKMFADLGQEDFLKGLKTGDAYAALKVTSPVFFEKDLSHPSYPFAIKTIDSSPVNIDIFNKTFRTFGENQGIEGRLPKEGQTVTEGFGVTTTTKPSFKLKQDVDLSHPSSIDLSGALGQYESVQRTQSLNQKANAQYRIESGKNIIEALRAFNKAKDKGKAVVAITHEIMHPTVVEIISGAKDGNEIGRKHTQTIVDEFNKSTGSNITVDELISGNDEFKSGKTTKQYRDVQEFIAESWEKYHTQGAKGFSAEFQKVLETITEAFKTVYKSLTGKELTPELKRMFDDILGKSEFKSEYEKQLLSEGKSKKRQENARKTIIDSNFEQIVDDLIRNNKMEKIC